MITQQRLDETMPPAAEERVAAAPFGVPLGANLLDAHRCEFRVWAPHRERIEIHIVAPNERRVAMRKNAAGYHEALVDCGEGTRYFFTLDGTDRPDPASRLQPEGVHGPSEVIGRQFPWHDHGWRGVPLDDYVIYELHVGTFTPDGTLDAAIEKLDDLRQLGITAVELLPIAQFPGSRNWGYDGTYPGAVQTTYGGPLALKRFVDAAHARGLAVILDVVYNHLGPEGNYLWDYGPYFTDRYKTPWGPALNFDGSQSDNVRWFFIHNALQWVDEFHIDALRVDAVHAIVDHSAEPFLQDLTTAVRRRGAKLGRHVYSIAESDLNDPRVITPAEELGLGFDAQWSDDFHHSLHALLTGEQAGYYQGFGRASDLAHVLTRGYLFTGQHSPYRGRRYGVKPRTRNGAQFVVCAQNHDQIGNRKSGDRLATLVNLDQLRLAAAAVILSPFLPMLFMGEEFGDTSPWQYFTSHSDPDLIEAVRRGRSKEFHWEGETPDPHDPGTFLRSKVNWSLLERDEHAAIHRLYQELLRLRRETPALRSHDMSSLDARANDKQQCVVVRRWTDHDQVLLAFNFSKEPQVVSLPFPSAAWTALIDTGAKVEENTITVPAESFAVLSSRA